MSFQIREYGYKPDVDFLPDFWVLYTVDRIDAKEIYWTGKASTYGAVTTKHLTEAQAFLSAPEAYSYAWCSMWRCPDLATFKVGRRPNKCPISRRRW